VGKRLTSEGPRTVKRRPILKVVQYLGNEPFSSVPSRSGKPLLGVSSPHGKGELKPDGGVNESGDYRV
jgi:hypothetical protein